MICLLSVCQLACSQALTSYPIQELAENSARAAWLQKTVYQRTTVDDMETPKNWSIGGIGEIEYTSDRSMDGSRSLRFRTSMRDEDFIRKDAEKNGTFTGRTGGYTTAVLRFDEPQDWTEYNRIGLWVYVHPTDMRIYSLHLSLICEGASANQPRAVFHIQTMEAGQWNYVVWEIPDYKRDKVTSFNISQSLHGHDPEVAGIVTYDIDGIELQKVDADKYEGWDVAPGKIAFSHVGYKPEEEKMAFAAFFDVEHFQLVDEKTSDLVLEKKVESLQNEQGNFVLMDFSEVMNPGSYYLRLGEITTRPFRIADTIWRQPIRKAINFHFCERCGYDVPTVHRVCHKDLQGTHKGENKTINGGWHDAADFSQGSHRTGMSIYAMLRTIEKLDKRGTDPELAEEIVNEALWGLDWLLRTRFTDGYRITWNVARIYTDNIIGTIDDIVTPAENIPWENFLASAVEGYSYAVLKERDPQFAGKCLTAAKEDWQAAVDRQTEWMEEGNPGLGEWGASEGAYLTLSWGITSSIHLYRITGDERYAGKAFELGQVLLSCQEREFKDNIPFTGYFYTGPEKRSILHHLHFAFEESPLIALTGLCQEFPEHEDWMEWYGAVLLHSEYFLKQGAGYSMPYNMIPSSIYRKSEFESIENEEVKQEMLRQFYEGTSLSEDYYFRRFPIWANRLFHGGTSVHLSETLALTAASAARGDLKGQQIASEQLQWVFGRNPFARSLMYGEGYDYLSYHAHRQRDFVGALPVGIDCNRDDIPFWSVSNYAVSKEIWIVPVNRFLWSASYLGMTALLEGMVKGDGVEEIQLLHQTTGIVYTAPLDAQGRFQLPLPSGKYTLLYGQSEQEITLAAGNEYILSLNRDRYINFVAKSEAPSRDKEDIVIVVEASGQGSHSLDLRLFNAVTDETFQSIDLKTGKDSHIEWHIRVVNHNSPWAAVIIPDGNFAQKQELNGHIK